MAARSRSKRELSRTAWGLMFDYLMLSSGDRQRAIESRGITPNDARAIWSLDPKTGRPIGSLAKDWACDPSNATFIIDRLEKAGFARREPSDQDRRVKLVFLTEKGERTKRELMAEYRTPPDALAQVPRDDLQALVDALERLPKRPWD